MGRFFGLILMVGGLILLGNELAFWDVDLFFDGWWTLFIIVPGLIGLFRGRWRSSIFLLLIGGFLFADANDFVQWNAFWPLMLILFGATILFVPYKRTTKNKKNINFQKTYTTIFFGREEKITGDLENFSINTIFGGVELDFSDSIISKDIVIDCSSVFSTVEITLPDNVLVEIEGGNIFGGVENYSSKTGKYKAIIKVSGAFSGVEIK